MKKRGLRKKIKLNSLTTVLIIIIAVVTVVIVGLSISDYVKKSYQEREGLEGELAAGSPRYVPSSILPIEREINNISNIFEVTLNINPDEINPDNKLKTFAIVECFPDDWIFVSASYGGKENPETGCIEWIAGDFEFADIPLTATQVSYIVIKTNENIIFSGEPVDVGKPINRCGNGECNVNEDCNNCPGDCPCSAGYVCKNGFCSPVVGGSLDYT